MGSCNILLSSQRFCCLLSYRADWISELSVWLTFSNTSLWLQESWSPRFASAHTLAPSSTASCSPPRARHYNLRARKENTESRQVPGPFNTLFFLILAAATPSTIASTNTKPMQCICKQMNHCHWDPASTSLFLDLYIDEKENKFNWNKEGLTTDGWRNVHKKFIELGG